MPRSEVASRTLNDEQVHDRRRPRRPGRPARPSSRRRPRPRPRRTPPPSAPDRHRRSGAGRRRSRARRRPPRRPSPTTPLAFGISIRPAWRDIGPAATRAPRASTATATSKPRRLRDGVRPAPGTQGQHGGHGDEDGQRQGHRVQQPVPPTSPSTEDPQQERTRQDDRHGEDDHRARERHLLLDHQQVGQRQAEHHRGRDGPRPPVASARCGRAGREGRTAGRSSVIVIDGPRGRARRASRPRTPRPARCSAPHGRARRTTAAPGATGRPAGRGRRRPG